MLNATENQNLDLIRVAEASKHENVQPGDMRYWRTRTLTAKKLGLHSGAEWRVLRAEVEAIHGKRFSEPWLQQYFDERYWYKPADKYDPKSFDGARIEKPGDDRGGAKEFAQVGAGAGRYGAV